MRPAQTTARLAAFKGRGPGTDAERRAAQWLVDELRSANRDVRLEGFWCRPNWALAHAWHAALGLGGSLLSVSSPTVGGALVLVALMSVVSDALTGLSPGRRLTFERASQNVVTEPRAANPSAPVRLIVTANYDAGRTGLVYRTALRAPAARLARLTPCPGWLGWFAIVLTWLLVIAVLRLGGAKGTAIGAAQLLPTVGLVAIGCLNERGLAPRSHQASDTAEMVDPDALCQTIQFALLIADEIDAFLGRAQSPAREPVK